MNTGILRAEGNPLERDRRHRKEAFARLRAPYMAVGAIGLAVHGWLAVPLYSWTDRLGAWILLVIVLVQLRMFMLTKLRGVPVTLLVAAQLYLYYGVPQFSQTAMHLIGGVYRPSQHALHEAVWLVVIGEVVFLACYHMTCRIERGVNLFDRLIPEPSATWRAPAFMYAVPTFVIYCVTSLNPAVIPLSIQHITVQLFNIWILLSLLLYLGYKLHDGKARRAAWALIAMMSILGVVQGFTGGIVFPLAMGFMGRWWWGRYNSFGWLMVLLVAVIIVNPVKNQYRQDTWSSTELSSRYVSSLDELGSRLLAWGHAFKVVWLKGTSGTTHDNLSETAVRASDLLSFAQVIDFVPLGVPYNMGKGMKESLLYWIPRVLWPSKGSNTQLLYSRYAVEFGYATTEGTKTTTVGASIFSEGYWNYGVSGVLIFLAVAGIMLGALLGHNGKNGDASGVIAMSYLGNNVLLLQALAVTIPSAISFAVGTIMAWWLVANVATLQGAKRS